MSAVIAEGRDGEPGGFDPEERVLHGQARGMIQAAEVDWAGRVVHLLLSFDGHPNVDGWDIPAWVRRKRSEGGH